MPDPEPSHRHSIFFGAKRLLESLPKVATGLVGLSGFAYFIGWAYARTYFAHFGASWILSELPILTVLGYSWWPVLILLFYAYLGVTDLAEIEGDKPVQDSVRFRLSIASLNYGRWVFIVIVIADVLLGLFGFPRLARYLSLVSILLVFAMATSAVEILVFRLSNPAAKFDLPFVGVTYAIILLGFYLAPILMGRNAALQDRTPTGSSLPVVVLRNDPSAEHFLLFSSGDRFYVFPPEDGTKYPAIEIVSTSEIQTIQRRNLSHPKTTSNP
ncbi:MAG TPA: hypothetical protein VMM76_22415 [Pirellulaceae bacterium]|nr:hypothetical protein [Pirellulaceae bacterium]